MCAAATGIPAKGTRKYRNYFKKQRLRKRKERQVAQAQTLLRKAAACIKPMPQQHRKQTAALEAENMKLKMKADTYYRKNNLLEAIKKQQDEQAKATEKNIESI